MKKAIDGNLVRCNVTRFGTNYLFLESFLRRKDCFIQWMPTPQLQQSGYFDSNAGKYAHTCLSSLSWCDNLKRIVESVQSLYAFLRFMDQERIANFSEVLFSYHILKPTWMSIRWTNMSPICYEFTIFVVVPPHLPHKKEVMSDLSLPSRLTSSYT
jgi:hypothetical protein